MDQLWQNTLSWKRKSTPSPGNTGRPGGRRLAGWEEWPRESQNCLRDVQREWITTDSRFPGAWIPLRNGRQLFGEQVLESAKNSSLGLPGCVPQDCWGSRQPLTQDTGHGGVRCLRTNEILLSQLWLRRVPGSISAIILTVTTHLNDFSCLPSLKRLWYECVCVCMWGRNPTEQIGRPLESLQTAVHTKNGHVFCNSVLGSWR